MAYYNVSGMEGALHLGTYLTAMNTLTGGLFFTVLLLVIGLVILMSMASRGYSMVDIGVVDGFVLTISAMLMFAAGLVAFWVIFIPFVLLLGAIIIRITSN